MALISILYIHQDGQITGSAISLRNMLSALDRTQFLPRVLLAAEGPARRLFEDLDIPVDVVPIHGYWTFPGPSYFERGFFNNFRALFPNYPLKRYLQQISPDIVHINDKAVLSAGLTAKSLGFPIVWHLRSTYAITNASLHALVSKSIIWRCADRMIAISQDETDGFDLAPNLSIIFNTVDLPCADKALQLRDATRRELDLKEDEFVVGLIGALNERKGAWDFIRAAGIARENNPGLKYRFVILAGIPERRIRYSGLRARLGLVDITDPLDKTWQLAKASKISDTLTLTGFRSDPLNVIAAFDVAVVANRLGVLGRPPFEAMSVGRPLIVTAGHTGKSTVVQPDHTGLVVPPGNIQALAASIEKLGKSPDLRRKLSENGMVYARESFDPQKNTRRVQEIYCDVLRNRRK